MQLAKAALVSTTQDGATVQPPHPLRTNPKKKRSSRWSILWDRFGLMPESVLSRLARST